MVFRWLRGSDSGLDEVQELFVGMLVDGRHVFDLAMSARVGGADPALIAEDLLRTEERTDESERELRRRVVVHASVHGTADLAACLMYMSIGKDAERIADLSKGLFDVAEAIPPPSAGELLDDLIRLRDEVSPMITEAARIFSEADEEAAHAFIAKARELQAHCNERITAFIREETELPQPAASAVSYRHIARILANLLNILSSVVVPLDQLDYPTPSEEENS